ncbi:MAG: hypothetical protein FWG65_03700, partial [Turicibacter sp.]|nr:hypothetical protein [Turicibacter sp.]
MTIYIKIKSLSKRRPIIDRLPLEIPNITTAAALIEFIVRHYVDEYNAQKVDSPILPYLTDDKLANAATTGKIGFGERKNENQQDSAAAVENALQCFEDGIFRLFVNDEEISLETAESRANAENITINEGDELTFIRLTMLAGGYWRFY